MKYKYVCYTSKQSGPKAHCLLHLTLHKMCYKEFVSKKKIEILLLKNLIMERFPKVALELLKQFLIAIMKLESSFIKFLLNQATI